MESNPATSIDSSDQDRVAFDRHVYRAEFNPDRCGAITVGLDVIEIARVERTLADFGQRFLDKVFTPPEQDRCRGRVPELAARFAAKEATSKALGTGIRGIRWREIEVLTNRRGKPVLVLHGNAAERAAALGLVSFDVSLTHSRTEAMAIVVALRHPGMPIGDSLDND
jgi:holo-[acyl-carrier protein] synthase